MFGAVVAIALLIPADLEFLAAICAFGATIAFMLVGASVCRLRYKEPDRDRPYRMPLNIGKLPIPGVLCVVLSCIGFFALLIEHGDARWVGVAWMLSGIVLYVGYRTSQGKHILKRVTVPESALTRRAAEAEYGSMLVPVLGTPLDDDIMQTAGRLAAEENADDGEGGAVIEALWIFEVPMALPLDARVPDAELKRARAALKRAKAVGEEYQGVEVATAVVRARRAGQAIVHEAKRRGVEAVVLAAEEPTRVGGGLRLGGKPGLHDTSVGETTRYVVNKAPCRVILTAPPAAAALDPMGPQSDRRAAPARPLGGRAPIARVLPVFVLVVGAGRVGAALATSALGRRPYGLGPRRGPAVARAARRRARPLVGGGRRALHDRHRAGGRRADRGRRRGGRRLHRLHQRRQHEPGGRADRAAALQRRPRDRARARPAPRGLVLRAGPADDLPDADRDRAADRGGVQRGLMAEDGLYVIIAGAGKVGWNLARELLEKGHEVTCLEQDRRRYLTVEQELEHAVQYGDATELWVLERAGIQRADLVVAVTGDDEDNLLICQVAKEKYLCERIIARVNNPRNLDHFKLLGIQPAVSATDLILRLIEHEVPRYGLVHLLDLPEERLEIIELVVSDDAPAAGQAIGDIGLPDGALVISVLRGGSGFVPKADTVVEAGDEVLVVLDPGIEQDITARFVGDNGHG